MARYVLIHGAWHWGGCWLKVANLLAAARARSCHARQHGARLRRHRGVRRHRHGHLHPAAREAPAGADEPAVLVGHSMGGASATYLVEHFPERIATVAYLAAFMCPAGKSPLDYIALHAQNPAGAQLFEIVTPTERGAELDASDPAKLKAVFYADCTDHDVDVARRNIIPLNPPAPFGYAAEAPPETSGVRRVYIECLRDAAIPIDEQRRMQADVPGAEIVTLDASHSPFFSMPEWVAEVLLALA